MIAAAAAILVAATGATDAAPDAAAGRCRYLRGVADAEQALLFSPQLFGSAGLARVDVDGDESVTRTRPRVVAGLELDAARLRRGAATGRLADAACALASAEEALAQFEAAGDAVVELPALRAREAVLVQALPQARAIVDRTRTAVERGAATIEEQQVMELRLSRLSAAAADVAQGLASLRPAPALDHAALQRQLSELVAARQEVHGAEAEIRASPAVSLSLRGGVDQVLDADGASGPPLFGLLTLSWYPGSLWQHAAEASAAEGLRRWSEAAASGAAERVRGHLEALRARASVERSRLAETRLLLADLERRHEELAQVPGERVAAFRDALFFELVTTRAEVAALEAGVRALERFFGADGA